MKKKWCIIGILAAVAISGFVACASNSTDELSKVKLSKAQIDEVEISSSHYTRQDVHKTFTDADSVKKYVEFFDELKLQKKSDDLKVSELDGGGRNVITFKSKGEIVKKYLFDGGNLICEEQKAIDELLQMEVTDVSIASKL